MKQIKIGFVGNGYRTKPFLRIIEMLPEVFVLEGMLFRNEEKARTFENTHPGKAFTEIEKFYQLPLDFVVIALPRECVLEYTEGFYKRGIPVLCETPPANGLSELKSAWELKEKFDGKIQVAEQYMFQPYHSALRKIVDDGMFGTVSNMNISMIHDYHGISMMRKLLSTIFTDCTIRARKYAFPVVKTCGRNGMISNSETVNSSRKTASFEFANGKVGFFDFCDEQYFNYLRTRHLSLQGDRGEIFDTKINYLNASGTPVNAEFKRVDAGAYSNIEGFFHRGIMLGERFIYENPFNKFNPRLNDDEIAIATVLLKMGEYVETGKDFYPLSEALQDTYLYLMMDESISTGKAVPTTKQIWSV